MISWNLYLRVAIRTILTSLLFHRPKHIPFYTKNYLQRTVQHLIKCCYFEAGNSIVLHTICIPMGVEPTAFWANLYLSKYKCDLMDMSFKDDITRAKNVIQRNLPQ